MLSDPVLECDWNKVLPVYNSAEERNRVKNINRNLYVAKYPLTREYLNNYYNEAKFSFKDYSSFIPDCAASMYSFFIMTFGYTPGGGGISYGFNPFFGLFDIDNPMLWIVLALAGVLVYKKITE